MFCSIEEKRYVCMRSDLLTQRKLAFPPAWWMDEGHGNISRGEMGLGSYTSCEL
jgi:hypothetical protein